jgi:hypothetical protein
MLYIPAMAKEAVDKSELQRKRLRRAAAAAYLTDEWGPNVSPNTLRSWPIPYKQLGRDATYEICDLDAFAQARIAGATVRRAGPSPDFAAMFEERRRLIAGHYNGEEARLRAFEFVVNAHRAHFGADLETSKRAVADAIAAHEAATKLKA